MARNTREIGSTGLAISGGFLEEEWNRSIKIVPKHKLYREMRDNDPVIGAILFVIEYLLSQQPWHLDSGEGKQGEKAKKFLEDCMDDMEHTWTDFIIQALSMVQYGWSYHEVVYKKRPEGGIGWLKLPLRAQSSLWSWGTDNRNRITGMFQYDPYILDSAGGPTVFIPRSKAVHFTTTSYKENPEGRSVLRSAVRPYMFLKRLQEIEAIGIERELAGLPIMHVPLEYTSTTASADKKAQYNNFKTLLMQIRRDERDGLILPSELDKNGKPTGFKFELLKGGGSRAIDTNAVINRYEQRISTTMLAQFILMGQQTAGSYALADKMASTFTVALQSILTRIADTINQQLIPTLMELNGFKRKSYPKIRAERLQDVSLTNLATFVNQMVATDAIRVDDDLEAHLRKIADLPPAGEPREPLESKNNPFGAGRPEDGDVQDRDDTNLKRKDPADGSSGGEDKVNVRTETNRKV